MKLLISFRSFIRHYCSRSLKSKVSEKLAGLTPKHEVRTGPAENMGAEGHRLYIVYLVRWTYWLNLFQFSYRQKITMKKAQAWILMVR